MAKKEDHKIKKEKKKTTIEKDPQWSRYLSELIKIFRTVFNMLQKIGEKLDNFTTEFYSLLTNFNSKYKTNNLKELRRY